MTTRRTIALLAVVAAAALPHGAECQAGGGDGSTTATPGREAPRPLTSRGLANVTAFAQALGYVRFFHPAPEAVHVNWDEFAVRGVRRVERAPGADSLAAALRAIFAPVAPTVAFGQTGVGGGVQAVVGPAQPYVVFWRNMGAGSPSGSTSPFPQSAYHSQRVSAPAAMIGKPLDMTLDAGLAWRTPPPRVPDPRRPLGVALAGGVTISLPVAMYSPEAGVPDSLQVARPGTATERLSADDRATRLADIALAWSLFDHFYPYFDIVQADWPRALEVALRRAATDRDASAFGNTLRRLVVALHDGHGNVVEANQSLAMPDARLTWAEGQVVVSAPGDSGLADGLHLGDVLVAIDGRPAPDVLAARSELAPGATPQWVRARSLAALLIGPQGSTVSVTVRGATGDTREVRLTRFAARQADDARVDKVAELAPGIMYVDLGRITDVDFAAALPRLEQARGIVFDMRGYPRQVNTPAILAHLTDSTIHSPHFEVPVLTAPDMRAAGWVDGAWAIAPAIPRLHARVAFLSGGGAISYAESTLGVVEAYRLGDIVGETSAGTNGNVNPFVLPGGYTVAWTGMLVEKRDGSTHHGVGIIPTIPVSRTIAGIRAGRDEVIERAVAVVSR